MMHNNGMPPRVARNQLFGVISVLIHTCIPKYCQVHCTCSLEVPKSFLTLCVALFTESSKPGVCITVIALEPSDVTNELQADFGQLADQGLPMEFCNEVPVPAA